MQITIEHSPECCLECHFFDPKPDGDKYPFKWCTLLRKIPYDTNTYQERDAKCPFDPKNKCDVYSFKLREKEKSK